MAPTAPQKQRFDRLFERGLPNYLVAGFGGTLSALAHLTLR
jgi:hypothetical protein